jgi:hypothetical protein
MSVSLTESQVRDQSKTVTRRIGWRMLHVGDQLILCRKVMGRRHGEPLERIAAVEVTAVRRERLDAISAPDVIAEGFPRMTPAEFVSFFCRTHRGCGPCTEVTRIEWRYLERPGNSPRQTAPQLARLQFPSTAPPAGPASTRREDARPARHQPSGSS